MNISKQEKTAIIGVIVNSLLTCLKFILAWMTQSIALKAEAIHSFSDIFSSVAVLWAGRKDRLDGAQQEAEGGPPRRWFIPGTWESKIAIGIGIFLILMSINVFTQTRSSIAFEIKWTVLAACIMAGLALLSFLLSKLEIHVGNETDSSALVADGYHARVDMVVSLFVALVLLGVRFGYQFDKPGAVAISVFILVNGIQALIKGLSCYRRKSNSRVGSNEDVFVLEHCLIDFLRRHYGRFRTRFQEMPKPKVFRFLARSKRTFVTFAFLFGVLLYLLSGFFVLNPAEEAIVETFGVPRDEGKSLQAGLHYAWPKPFGRVRWVDSGAIRRLEMNYQVRRDQPDFILWTNVHYLAENAILTGENSFLDLALVVHYRIANLNDYIYENKDPEGLLKSSCYSAIRKEVGTRLFFDVMTSDRKQLETILKTTLQKDSDLFRLGLEIQGACLLDLHPPMDIAISFEDVVSAQEDYETFVEEAKGYRMDIIPRGRATACKTISSASGQKTLRVKRSTGTSEAFLKRLEEYNNSKEITEKRLLLETMEEVLTGVPKYIVPTSTKGAVPRMWVWQSPLVGGGMPTSQGDYQQNAAPLKRSRINTEEDLVDAMQKMRMGIDQ